MIVMLTLYYCIQLYQSTINIFQHHLAFATLRGHCTPLPTIASIDFWSCFYFSAKPKNKKYKNHEICVFRKSFCHNGNRNGLLQWKMKVDELDNDH